MRGSYNTTHEDRRRFFRALCEMMRKPKDGWYDLISTQLCMSNCEDLLEELGYEKEYNETNGWEGELWMGFYHPTAPGITFQGSAYLGDLSMVFTGLDDGEEPDVEALRVVINEKWGKYFPVI